MPNYFKPSYLKDDRSNSPIKINEAKNINELMKPNFSPNKSTRLPYLKEASDMNQVMGT